MFVFYLSRAEPYCDECTNADVFADVYYTGDKDGLGSQLHDEFVAACDDIKDIEGVANTFDPCPTISVTPVEVHDGSDGGAGGVADGSDGGDVEDEEPVDMPDASVDEPAEEDGNKGTIDGVIEDTSKSTEEDKVAAGAIFGMILAALVILALLFLLCRRRRNNDEEAEMLKNLSHEDELPDQTAMLDENSRYEDNDSRFGMYPEGRGEGMVLGERALNQDVHKCSSATCELCDRQNGVQFLPTRARSSRARVDLAGSDRKYGSEDTVNL